MTKIYHPAVDILDKSIAAKEMLLDELRDQYDRANANDATNLTLIAQKISQATRELNALTQFRKQFK